MNILLAVPGHLKTVPMGAFTKEALDELGHAVTVFDYRPTRLDKVIDSWNRGGGDAEEKRHTNRRLRKLVDRVRPDLFITLFGFDVSAESLQHLRARGIPTACWWINDPFQFQRSLKKAHHYDFIFSNSAGCVDEYRAAGIANAFFLPTACHPRVHRPVPAVESMRCEVCFAGDWSAQREQLMTELAGQFDVRVFGPWKKKLHRDSPLHRTLHNGFFTPDQMAAMFCSADVVINLHTWFETYDHGVNPRLFEAAGCGAYQLVDWKREIPELFDCETQVRCYRSLDQIPQFIQAAVDDPAARTAAARSAHERAYAEHTYRHRMEQLLRQTGI